jgi:hypothetical protein
VEVTVRFRPARFKGTSQRGPGDQAAMRAAFQRHRSATGFLGHGSAAGARGEPLPKVEQNQARVAERSILLSCRVFRRRGAMKLILGCTQPFFASGDIFRKRSAHNLAVTDQQRGSIMTKSSFRKAALMAALVVSFSTLSTSGYAFSPEAQQMCTGDAFRLCSSEIPDIPRVTACMIKNRASLSSGCRTVMDREAQQSPAVASKNSITIVKKPPLG